MALSAELGWVLAAQKKYVSAKQSFYQAGGAGDTHTRADSEMGIAVAAWNQSQPEEAVSSYRAAVRLRSAWANLHSSSQARPGLACCSSQLQPRRRDSHTQ